MSGTPLKGIRRADVAHQRIIGAVTSGANKPRPSDCNTRPIAPAKQQRLVVIQACITLMYRRYGPGIIITITSSRLRDQTNIGRGFELTLSLLGEVAAL